MGVLLQDSRPRRSPETSLGGHPLMDLKSKFDRMVEADRVLASRASPQEKMAAMDVLSSLGISVSIAASAIADLADRGVYQTLADPPCYSQD